jgi:anthranilate phosphoribosyltransferase
MNAGAALTVARGVDPKEGAVEAARALRNGLAHAALERWRAAARRAGAR